MTVTRVDILDEQRTADIDGAARSRRLQLLFRTHHEAATLPCGDALVEEQEQLADSLGRGDSVPLRPEVVP